MGIQIIFNLFKFVFKNLFKIISLSITLFFVYSYISDQPKLLTQASLVEMTFNHTVPEFETKDPLALLSHEGKQSMFTLRQQFQEMIRNPNIKGVLLHAPDHAAFGLAQAQELRQWIKAMRDAKKKVFVYTDTFGEMSNGTVSYYWASAADRIFMQPFGILGITGFSIERPFLREALDNHSIKPVIERREEFKSAAEMFTEKDFTGPARENMETMLRIFLQQIVQDVAKDRGIADNVVQEAIHMAPLMDKKASELKLITDIGAIHQARTALKTETEAKEFVKFGEFEEIDVTHQPKAKKLVVIYLHGEIVRGDHDSYEAHISDLKTVKMIDKCRDDKEVSGIVLRIDSPGGSAIASETIWQSLKFFKESGKKIVVSMGNVCASGGYYMATAADKIVAQPGTITGSIGVIMGKVVTEAAWNKYGVRFGQINSSKNANMWSTRDDFTDEQKTRVKGLIDQVYQGFIEKVAEARHLKPEQAHELAKGRVWTGKEALDLDLVDKLGGLDDALDILKEILKNDKEEAASYEVVYLPLTETPFEMFINAISGAEDMMLTLKTSMTFIKSVISGKVKSASFDATLS